MVIVTVRVLLKMVIITRIIIVIMVLKVPIVIVATLAGVSSLQQERPWRQVLS